MGASADVRSCVHPCCLPAGTVRLGASLCPLVLNSSVPSTACNDAMLTALRPLPVAGPIPTDYGCNGSLMGLASFVDYPGALVFARGGLTLSGNSLSGALPGTFTQTYASGFSGCDPVADDCNSSRVSQLVLGLSKRLCSIVLQCSPPSLMDL